MLIYWQKVPVSLCGRCGNPGTHRIKHGTNDFDWQYWAAPNGTQVFCTYCADVILDILKDLGAEFETTST